jgi:hypothetical protein
MRARQLIDEAFEADRADSDPTGRPRMAPRGFEATRDDELVKEVYDQRFGGYRLSKDWTDPYTGRRRSLDNGGFIPVRTPERAVEYIEGRIREYEEAGWAVKRI